MEASKTIQRKEGREMGNNVGRRKKAKVMKINGETFKLKTPIIAWDVIKDYPGHVLLESGAVKQLGIRAKPLEQQEELKPNKAYFLVDLPNLPEEEVPVLQVLSGVHTGEKGHVGYSVSSRRSASDLSVVGSSSGPVRIKMRLPKSQMDKLVEESKDEADVAKKIIDLCMQNICVEDGMALDGVDISMNRQVQLKLGLDSIRES